MSIPRRGTLTMEGKMEEDLNMAISYHFRGSCGSSDISDRWHCPEDPNDIHTVSRNASSTKPAKFLVFLIKEKGAPSLVLEK